MRSKMKWEQHGSCVMCGNPIFARGLSADPEVRRTCFCVPNIPLASVSVPSAWTPREHASSCAVAIARTGWWSVMPPACDCGADPRITTTTTVITEPCEITTGIVMPPVWQVVPGYK